MSDSEMIVNLHPVVGASVAHTISGIVGKESRPKGDFYPTPPHATAALLDVEKFDGGVWEPACGAGAISSVLISRGIKTKSTDLYDYGYGESGVDFLSYPITGPVDNIITNPPYNLAKEFVDVALFYVTGKVAMLLKLSFLEGVSRMAWFKKTPLKYVYVFSRRISLTRMGQAHLNKGMISYAWFVWQIGWPCEPVVRWIDCSPNAAPHTGAERA